MATLPKNVANEYPREGSNFWNAKDVLSLVDELLKEDSRFTQIIPFVQLEYKTKDIAEEVGCSQPQVSKVKKKFIKLFYEKYPDLKEYIESL